MRTIAFVTQKGGSGKSTLAACVAVAARQAGEKVFVIDMDRLGSLVEWSTKRNAADIAVQAVPAASLKQVLSKLEKDGVTLVVIDTPGAEDEAILTALKAADLCIIPARPNAFDLWASSKTRAAIKSVDREFAFLLNQCPPAQQTARVEMGAKALEAMGGLLTPMIQSRVDYQEAAKMGRGVTELSEHSAAAEEMRALWGSIKRRLNRAAQARKTQAAKAEADKVAKATAAAKATTAKQALTKTAAKPAPAAKAQATAKPASKMDAKHKTETKAVRGKAA